MKQNKEGETSDISAPVETSSSETSTSGVGKKTIFNSFTVKKGNFTLILSIVVFLVVIGLSGFFTWQNSLLGSQISDIRGKTSEYQTKLDVLKADPLVRSGELFAGQKDILAKAINKSNAATYVREMQKMQKDFGFYFNGFSFAQNKVTSSIVATKGLDPDAAQKIIKFIAGYRETTSAMGTGAIVSNTFELSPVLSVGGDTEKRNISVEFTVK